MLVSAIIPSFNHEQFVIEAAYSILNQTVADLELIIIDDGSKDGSVNELSKINDSRLRLYRQENQGAHAAINRGLSLAQGEYVTILNSDDIFHKERFQVLIDHAIESKADLLVTWIEIIDEQGNLKGLKKGWKNCLPSWATHNAQNSFNASNDFVQNLLMSNFVSTTSNIFMKNLVPMKIGGMRNLRFAHDWDYMLRATEKFTCLLVEKPLMQYRIHGNNTISSNERWMLFEIAWTIAANLHRFENDRLYKNPQNKESLLSTVSQIGNSICPKRCDRLLWMLRQFFDIQKQRGKLSPEEDLLEDKELRECFMNFID